MTEAATITARERWLAERRSGIGGSDAAAAVGLSRWKTPLQLYLEKRGELADEGETDAMRWGTMLEPIVRQEFCNRTGMTVRLVPAIQRHARLPFAIANLDGIIPEINAIYEGKTSQSHDGWGEPGTADIPDEYALQVQHYMAVMNLPRAEVAVLFGVRDMRTYTVFADSELQEMLMDREAEFWRRVLEADPPDPTNPADMRRRWPVSRPARVVASRDTIDAHARLAAVREAIEQLDALKDGLTSQLQAALRDAEELATESGEVLATWKTATAPKRFDAKAFEKDYPELYARYLMISPSTRRFLLKTTKGMLCQPILQLLSDLAPTA